MGYKKIKLEFRHEAQLEQTMIYLCGMIRQSAIRRCWTHKELALLLGTSQGCVSRVIRAKTDDLTINQLFRYLVILEPDFKILISI